MFYITSFKGVYSFLSNFFPHEMVYLGFLYPTLEHAYQAAKSPDPQIQLHIRGLATAGEAKRYGRKVILRAGWDNERLTIMKAMVTLKFQNKSLATKLLSTKDFVLIEGNTWGDKFWGVDGVGHNHLGQILMEVRDGIS